MNDLADNAALDRVVQSRDRQQLEKAVPPLFTLYQDIEVAPRKDMLVQNFLGAGEQSVIFGAPGSAKSALAVDSTAHIAAGREWFGRRVQGGAVLYVAIERTAVVKRRLAAWQFHHGIEDLPLAVIGGQFDLRSSPADTDKLIAASHQLEDMTGQKLVLIIVETVNRALAGGDENSSKDMGALVGNLDRLANRTGAHVSSTHHIPADGTQRLRGHGSLFGAMDTTILVEKVGDLRIASVQKQSDGEEGERVVFDLQSVDLHHDDETGITTTAPVVIPRNESEAPKKADKRKGRPNKAATIAERALIEALDECGKAAPASSHMPAGVRVVSIDRWRDYAYRRGISASDDPDAQRKAFQRASEHLIAANSVGVWDNQVWNAT